jgi:serine/threonine protein kinase
MRTDHRGSGTLADRLRSGPLTRDELDQLARDLLGMLVSLHAEGTLHTDLNPATVRLDSAGRLHSSKIGAQRAPGGAAPLGPTGPRNYLAPEVLAGGSSDVGADLFACGVLLGDAAGPDASAPVMVLVGMLTASEPDMRPASAAEALALLGGTAAPAPQSAPQPTPQPSPKPVQQAMPPAPRAPLSPPAVGYRQSFEKPAGATSAPAPAAPAQSAPVVAPQDVPTEAIEFPPVVNFPPARDVPPAVQVGAPVDVLAAYPPAPVALPRVRTRMWRRPSRRVVAALVAVPVLLGVVAVGVVATSGGSESGTDVPPPGEGALSQQLDELDNAIDLVAK